MTIPLRGLGLFLGSCLTVACGASTDSSASDAQSLTSWVANAGSNAKGAAPAGALTACSGKASGDACSLSCGDKAVSGTCAATADGQVACFPTPPAALTTPCVGKASADSCSLTDPKGNTVTGTCQTTPTNVLVCRPTAPAQPPSVSSPCSGKASGDACSVTFGDQTITGSCAAPTGGPGGGGGATGGTSGNGGNNTNTNTNTGNGPALICVLPPPPPPQALVDACTGLATGAACSATLNGHALTGTCQTPPNATVALRLQAPPAGPPPRK